MNKQPVSKLMGRGTIYERTEWRLPNGKWRLWRFSKGKLHREDGPAVELADGTKSWYKHDKLHREDGPAIESANGDKFWIQHGKNHREDGPAVERVDGEKEYWLHGEKYSEEEFEQVMKSNSNNSPKIKM